MMKDPLIGQQLANFRVESVLGRGGMAQVYYGQDIKLQRPVAIKVIDARYRDKPAYANRFVNEARVLAKWRHEHIIQIYYADDEDGLYYYVMEYIDGQNLGTILSSYAVDGELMPIPDVLHVGNAVADALDYAHKQGVIHRDVKPSNILVAKDGRVVLSDFGLAMDLHDGSLGETFGTPHYISPEQASRSANAVPQSDLYSLGVILYEALVGVVPFNDPSPTSVALQHITEPPPPPRSINPDLPVEVEDVLLKALEKSPEDRYQTGVELLSALKLALATKTETAKAPLPPLPVNVPTIMRRPQSKESITQRVASASLKNYVPPQGAAIPVQQEKPVKRRKRTKKFSMSWFLFFGLLFFLVLIFAWTQGWFQTGAFSKLIPLQPAQTATLTETPTATITETVQPSPTASPTATRTTVPSLTASPAWTTTSLPSPTITQTITYTPVATNTVTDAATLTAATPTFAPTETPSIKYPDGRHFMLYYNDNSLYLHNLSRVSRSISGFTFERLDAQGEVLNLFGGWDWDVFYPKHPNLTPDNCMAIQLYESPPYLKPAECKEPYLSLLNPPRDDDRIFWTEQENSSEFRVLWRNEEVARCKIGGGDCDIFVP